MWNSYQCGDGTWVLLVMAVPFPGYWPRFAAMAGREDWVRDYPDLRSLRAASAALTAEFEAMFGAHGRAYWKAKLDESGLIWAPVAKLTDVIADPQVREMEWIRTLDHAEFGPFETLDTPFKLYGSDTGARGPAPSVGQHTSEVLSEFGVAAAEVSELAAKGVLG
ncbi:MAG: CoA transferase [Tepidiformaceae bacterium]